MGNSCSGSKKIVVDGEQAREIVTEANNFIKETGGTGLHFTKLQVIHLAQKFKNKGMGDSLSREEFQTMFALENASLNILFDAFDLDGSGSLDLSEMIAGFSFLCRGTLNEKLRFLFSQYDRDNSGFLENGEILPIFQQLTGQLIQLEKARLKSYKANSSKERECKKIIDRCEAMEKDVGKLAESFQKAGDLDGDGKISYEEFEEYMENSSLCKEFLKMLVETTDVVRHEEGNFNRND